MTREQTILWIAFLAPAVLGSIACSVDIRERRIPNWISVTLALSGLIFNLSVAGGNGLFRSLSGFAVGFLILFVLYLVGGGGAGDVKFMGGLGAWIGPYHVLFVFVISAIFIAIYSAVIIAVRMIATKGVSELVAGDGDLGDGTNPRVLNSSTVSGKEYRRSVGEQKDLDDTQVLGSSNGGVKVNEKSKRTRIPYAVPCTFALVFRLGWLILIRHNL